MSPYKELAVWIGFYIGFTGVMILISLALMGF